MLPRLYYGFGSFLIGFLGDLPIFDIFFDKSKKITICFRRFFLNPLKAVAKNP
jgi:hypothetical protein